MKVENNREGDNSAVGKSSAVPGDKSQNRRMHMEHSVQRRLWPYCMSRTIDQWQTTSREIPIRGEPPQHHHPRKYDNRVSHATETFNPSQQVGIGPFWIHRLRESNLISRPPLPVVPGREITSCCRPALRLIASNLETEISQHEGSRKGTGRNVCQKESS